MVTPNVTIENYVYNMGERIKLGNTLRTQQKLTFNKTYKPSQLPPMDAMKAVKQEDFDEPIPERHHYAILPP